jgi:microcystin degradation protein MlrC
MEGFAPCDLPHTGTTVFTYATSQAVADQAAERLYQYILDHEYQFVCDLVPWDEAARQAVELAKTAQAPIILADLQDNAGGGSPSDSTWLLESLVKYGATKTALGLIHDPEAAAAAFAAGEGAEIDLDVGGKSLPGHHPFRARFKVVKLHDGDFLGTGPMVKDRLLNLGKMAQLVVDDVRVVVASERMQALDQSLFRVVGIEPKEMRILALKSANHYRADFGPIASQIINVESPSAIIEDPSKIPYTNLREGVRLKGLGPVYHRPA